MKKRDFFALLKAMRIERSLMPLSFIMIAVGFADKITLNIFILMACCVMMYTVGGLINAKADKDFEAKKINIAIIVLLFISLILSFNHYIIFLAVIASLFMGFVYNKVFRFFLFGDSIALAITHVIIPIVSSSLILNLSTPTFISVIPLAAIPFGLIAPMKNLRGITGDKKRHYKTLMTTNKNGKQITYVLLSLYFIAVFAAYFILDLGNRFLFVVFILFIVKVFMDYYMINKKEIIAYGLVRLVIITLPFAFVFDKTSNISFIALSFSFIFIYFLYFISKIKSALKAEYV